MPIQPIPFIVLFTGRSGSTFLVEALDSHPRIRAEKELFAVIRKQMGDGSDAGAEQLRQCSDLYTKRSTAYGAVGFKAKEKDILDPHGFAELLRTRRARVVLLRRRNRVKQVVSLMRGLELYESSGEWNLYRREDKEGPSALDPKIFVSWLQGVERDTRNLEQYVSKLCLPTLDVHYEEILQNPAEVLARAQRFLDVEPMPLQAETLKHTSDHLRNVVSNFDELRDAVRGSTYEVMFDEVLVPTVGSGRDA